MAPVHTAETDRPCALVTGASSGIGKALATQLVTAGYQVFATARHLPGRDLDPAFTWLELDGSEPDKVHRFLEEQADLLGRLDLLVNNAGFGLFGSPEDLSSEEIRGQLELMLILPIAICRAVAPGMRQRGKGSIINVSSLAAKIPLPWMASYCAAKAGLSAFTRNCALTEPAGALCWIDLQLGDFRTAFNKNMAARGEFVASKARAWQQLEAHLQAAPPADLAARDTLRAIRRGRSGTVISGSWFQSICVPLALRLLPEPLFLALVRAYYGLPLRG